MPSIDPKVISHNLELKLTLICHMSRVLPSWAGLTIQAEVLEPLHSCLTIVQKYPQTDENHSYTSHESVVKAPSALPPSSMAGKSPSRGSNCQLSLDTKPKWPIWPVISLYRPLCNDRYILMVITVTYRPYRYGRLSAARLFK